MQRVEVLQTVVRSVHGIQKQLGTFFWIHFYAPLNEECPEEEIVYDYKSMPSDYELISKGEDQAFLQKQCLKFGDYIQKVRNWELLQMKAEFFKDANGDIWFYYAKDIQMRMVTSNKLVDREEANKKVKQAQKAKEATRNQMIEELAEYEQKMSSSKNKSIERMYDVMKGYYDNLKQEVNIVTDANVDEDDHELEGILTTLKPNTTAENFKEFLLRKDNNTKSQAWRKISRKIYKDEEM